MPLPAAVPVKLTGAERKTLKKRTRGAKPCGRDRVRAQIVLLAAWPLPNAVIARRLGLGEDTVRKWRGRFAARGLGGLDDLSRSGRPRQITAAERAAICALACQLPAATGVPLARWSGPELATEVTAAGLVRQVSPSSVLRILAEHPIKPWQHQSWIYPREEDFEAKAKVVRDLSQGYYHGEPLGPGDRVVPVDAKPSIKARKRCHRTIPAGQGKPARVEHEYQCNGALALLAVLDVHTGEVFASTPATTGIAPFMALMDQVMTRQPYNNAGRRRTHPSSLPSRDIRASSSAAGAAWPSPAGRSGPAASPRSAAGRPPHRRDGPPRPAGPRRTGPAGRPCPRTSPPRRRAIRTPRPTSLCCGWSYQARSGPPGPATYRA